MKKEKDGPYRNWFLFVVSVSFLFSVFLFYFDSSLSLGTKNLLLSKNDFVLRPISGVTPVPKNNHVHSILNISPLRHSLFSSENPIKTIAEKSLIDNGLESSSGEDVSHETEHVKRDPCSGKYIYVHHLPSRFNSDIVKECRTISPYEDMCSYLSNEGFGTKMTNTEGVLTNKGWFNTHFYLLDVIFHNRMKQYKCLTNTSSLASAVYVPFYAGLDVFRYLRVFNTTMRDSTSHSLVKWLTTRPEWKVLSGRDHFLVSGRATWEHRRTTNEDSDWGNNLLLLPEVKNMTVLLPAASPWQSNDFAIPYPSYFHPSTDNEVVQWQNRMRGQQRKHLFCFVDNPQSKQLGSIRNQIIEQCQGFKGKCQLLQCGERESKCQSSSTVIELFQNSVFCLQSPGDDPTPRSTFDYGSGCILSGCIPVLFHPMSAYPQYTWHMPQNYSKYSVFIAEDDVRKGKVSIDLILNQISDEDVRAMRNEVIRLIPRLMYAHPTARMKTIEDAFDVAVRTVIEKINEMRKEIKEGLVSKASDEKEYSRK